MILKALNIAFLLALTYWLSLRYQSVVPRKITWIAALVKLMAGVTIGYWYMIVLESGDTIQYHGYALDIADKFNQDPFSFFQYLWERQLPDFKGEARTIFFSKWLSTVLVLADGSYWISIGYFSILNLSAALFLIRNLSLQFPRARISAIISFLFLPSLVMWSSGVFKEAVIIPAIFLLAAATIRFSNGRKSYTDLLIAVACCYVLFKIRFFLLAVILMVWVAMLAFNVFKNWSLDIRIKAPAIALVVLVLVYATTLIHHHLQLHQLPYSLLENQQLMLGGSNQNNFEINFEANYLSLILHSPYALLSGFFRPLPGEGSIFNAFAWLEHSLLMVLLILNLRQLRAKPDLLTVGTIVYCAMLATALAFATPNFGTLIRYKTSFFPFIFFLLSVLPMNHILSKRLKMA